MDNKQNARLNIGDADMPLSPFYKCGDFVMTFQCEEVDKVLKACRLVRIIH